MLGGFCSQANSIHKRSVRKREINQRLKKGNEWSRVERIFREKREREREHHKMDEKIALKWTWTRALRGINLVWKFISLSQGANDVRETLFRLN